MVDENVVCAVSTAIGTAVEPSDVELFELRGFDQTVPGAGPIMATDDQDLSRFRDRGGMVIVWHGWRGLERQREHGCRGELPRPALNGPTSLPNDSLC